MEEVLKGEEHKVKYDFSNPESQRLFEEFTLLLAELTKKFEGLDEDKGEFPSSISSYRSRDLLREVFARFYNLLAVKWDILKKKIKNIFNINR
jgi:hypothetical protein